MQEVALVVEGMEEKAEDVAMVAVEDGDLVVELVTVIVDKEANMMVNWL